MDMTTAMERLSWSWGGKSWQSNPGKWPGSMQGQFVPSFAYNWIAVLSSHFQCFSWAYRTSMLIRVRMLYWAQDPNSSVLTSHLNSHELQDQDQNLHCISWRQEPSWKEVWKSGCRHCSILSSYAATLKCLQGRCLRWQIGIWKLISLWKQSNICTTLNIFCGFSPLKSPCSPSWDEWIWRLGEQKIKTPALCHAARKLLWFRIVLRLLNTRPLLGPVISFVMLLKSQNSRGSGIDGLNHCQNTRDLRPEFWGRRCIWSVRLPTI